MQIEQFILFISIIIFLAVVASKTSGRLGVPSLLVFLVIGMLLGDDGLLGLTFSNARLSQSIGVVALIFILFSGGYDTSAKEVKKVMWPGIVLATVGVLIVAVVTGLFVWKFTRFTLLEGLLLGSIVSSTDAAAVFSILRSRNLGLKRTLRPLLEFESGSNDPMAYFLTTIMLQVITGQLTNTWMIIPLFIMQMVIGAVAGYFLAKGAIFLLNRIRLDYDGLYPVFMLAFIFFIYSASTLIKGNGFLAIYIAGVVFGNSQLIHKRSIGKFYDGIAWLMQIIMFIILGLLVTPHQILPLIGMGILISLFLIFVGRPISVFVSLIPFKIKLRDKLLVSWVGLRGAVPVILATFPLVAGVPRANEMFNLVFFIVITSVIFQGMTIPYVAKLLRVYKPEKNRRRYPLEIESTNNFHNELIDIAVPPDTAVGNRKLMDYRFPQTVLVVLVERNEKYITPNGGTIIKPGDHLLVMTDNPKDVKAIQDIFGSNDPALQQKASYYSKR